MRNTVCLDSLTEKEKSGQKSVMQRSLLCDTDVFVHGEYGEAWGGKKRKNKRIFSGFYVSAYL